MIPPLLLLLAPVAAAAGPPPSPAEARYDACVALVERDPARALAEAEGWRLSGGGVPARQCAGLAYAAQQRFPAAATAFEQAAREAENRHDARVVLLWVQAGNAALAGGDPGRARGFLDAALARGELAGDMAGEAYLDRARARVALGDMTGARNDLDQAVMLVPADPLGWLLSATLARKMGDLPRARTDIAEAFKRSPDDAGVALEAGNIALLSGHDDAARTAWQAAVANQPGSPAARSAAEALKQLGPE